MKGNTRDDDGGKPGGPPGDKSPDDLTNDEISLFGDLKRGGMPRRDFLKAVSGAGAGVLLLRAAPELRRRNRFAYWFLQVRRTLLLPSSPHVELLPDQSEDLNGVVRHTSNLLL